MCIRDRPRALEQLREENADELGFWRFLQYQGYRQWMALKAYANGKGVQILGDIPIYVAADSADAWAGGKLFQVDGEGRLTRVAGCPPDYFSEDGQLWGNPLYDWTQHKASGYAWWIRRVEHALTMYDRLRIDHFRAFDTYYAIPAGRTNARVGDWEYGPGMDLFRTLEEKLGKLPIVAEDLGDLFDSVRVLLKESGYPGMKAVSYTHLDVYKRQAVLICARNEAAVLPKLLESLRAQDYPGVLDLYVAADNCTDDTARLARKGGATVFELSLIHILIRPL